MEESSFGGSAVGTAAAAFAGFWGAGEADPFEDERVLRVGVAVDISWP